MTEISATIDDNDVGELEVFDIRDVETSADTVDYENHEDDDNHDSQDQMPLHIDISGNQDVLIMDEIVTMTSPKNDDSKKEQNDEQNQEDCTATSSTRTNEGSSQRRIGTDT